jgi:hypothetical protein
METMAEAMKRLHARGYTDDFQAVAGGLKSVQTDVVQAPEAFRVDEVVRFEGDSDPGDESAIFALTPSREGRRGTYTVAYGPAMDSLDVEMVERLPRPRSANGPSRS